MGGPFTCTSPRAFQAAHDRPYLGSRDIDLGIHIETDWTTEEMTTTSVATTLQEIEEELGYTRGRFGFYQQFHRDTGERLSDDEAKDQPPHNIFRVDIDIIPDITALDAFHEGFGFRPLQNHCLNPHLPLVVRSRSMTTFRGTHLRRYS